MVVHVNNLLLYQADIGDELQDRLEDRKPNGHRAIGTQTFDCMTAEIAVEPVHDWVTDN